MSGNAVPAPCVSICVCTYKRPHLIDGLMQALQSQSALGRVLEIIVVDNDPQRSAMPALKRWQAQSVVPLVALSCAEPNISLARNTAIHQAAGIWLAFIDDDELPVETWLAQLLKSAEAGGVDAVFGPVLPRYPETAPQWVVQGGFFERRRLPSGAPVGKEDVRSGNVLIRREALLAEAGPFDAAFGRTGGEDTLLFSRMLDRQASFVWNDEAVVFEPVEANRMNARWLLRRAYRGGQTYIRVVMLTRAGANRAGSIVYLLSRAVVQLGLAGVLAVLTFLWSPTQAFRWLRIAVAQCGKISGAIGFRHQEYRH
ncbi:glycosyltransferase family 2 protein [Pusillimonas sp. CC-YST705]|uniref:Glycosyltransferase family 2 protein n=1 Tax=Mesopusillimonas faecipullorum TaxID=2755040 RepID=A0ABS8CES9_9BURK|nr:glycosyltransferase family A protein [Mesopusillimonas faecipullorum]MCB5364551.1 glycosyltransferase family 2 protein [Mesopusillimonas faecipullorum]